MKKLFGVALAVGLLAAPIAAVASNALLAPTVRVQIAHNVFAATPTIEWNRLSFRPSQFAETWTRDGPGLNSLTFYGGVTDGQPLLRNTDRRNRPMPNFSATMLPTDIPTLLGNSYRISREAGEVTVTNMQPATFSRAPGVRFTYEFTDRDEIRRRGEALGAIRAGKLYLVTFEAPVIFYFDRDAAAARAVIESITIN